MIKSVATALPTYIMSCFRLPKNITKALTTAVARFWCSTDGVSKGLHWLSWKKLCRLKSDGGLGFKNLEVFNTALLAKQLWRLMEFPDSLFAKVMKGRYYRTKGPMDPSKVYSPSYGWRSIISARSLVQKGLIKRVGNGSSISVWKDPWIPSLSPRSANGIGQLIYPNLKVFQLINHSTGMWNTNLIHRIISPSDGAIIQSIPISLNCKSDANGWHYTKCGKYTVKSGYATENNSIILGGEGLFFGPDYKALQAHIWKINCPRKIQHFIWQTISGCIPVSMNLKKRGITCETRCVRCGAEEETINHVLFECPPALQVWALSTIPSAIGNFPVSSVHANLDYLFWRLPEECNAIGFPWLMWYIWKARNDKLFNDLDWDPTEILDQAEAEASTWVAANVITAGGKNQRELQQVPNTAYQGPKCFIDGSWKEADFVAGLGWIAFQANGMYLSKGAKNLRKSLSPLHTEFEALIWAMLCLVDQQQTSMTFVTDCSELVKVVQAPTEWPAFSIYIEEFTKIRARFSFFSLERIPRSLNAKADCLAKTAR